MKILYVFRSLAMWGGIERILVDKMNGLVSRYGDEVTVLTADQGNHPIPYYIYYGVRVEDLAIRFHQQYQYRGLRRIYEGWRLKRLFERKLKERIQTIQPDVIVCVATSYADSVCRVAGDIPVIVESHSICRRTLFPSGLRQLWKVFILRRQLRKAKMIVALTEGDAQEWRRYYPNVTVIPNLVNLGEPRAASEDTPKYVIFVGRFDYQKRVLEAIAIWQIIYPRFPDWHLDIYGDGEERGQIEELVESLNMNIHIYQPSDRIFDFYRDSAFLISTSLYEPFGLVLAEAMSCGLPVIAYDCPYGPGSIITEGKDGFLVPLDDRDVFAERMCQLMKDSSLRMQMGKAAVELSKRYSADIIMPLWKQLFETIISSK